ncbi:MAG: aminopeptidase P N-terminal domain-containing protein [Candidatus Saccharibacteria bacterium]
MFTSDFFAGNRERLRQLFTGTAPIVITAHGSLQRGSDEAYPFQQDTNFWYLTGLNDPDLILVMDKGREYIITPQLSRVQEIFDGSTDVNEMTRISGIATIYPEKEGLKQLEARIKRVQHVATLAAPAPYIDVWGMYTNPARAGLAKRLRAINAEIELLDLRPHLSRMRMIKQEPELAALQQAIDITIDTLKEVTKPKQLAKYAYEYELEADITRGFRSRGAGGLNGHAFTPIVAGGPRACTMHHVQNDGALASDELIVLDVGADFGQYSADITRTVIAGEPTRRQRAVHEAVLSVQQFGFSLLKPGVVFEEYEQQIVKYMGEKLRELGLIKSITDESVRTYFPHATSHFLGLNTHDAGDYERSLEPGVVMTVEPGIYIPEEGIGIRIEDDVLITATGITILTNRLPRNLP